VDFDDDDAIIEELAGASEKMVKDIMRVDTLEYFVNAPHVKTAVLYATAYLYEHREDADHHALILTLRSMLFGSRREVF